MDLSWIKTLKPLNYQDLHKKACKPRTEKYKEEKRQYTRYYPTIYRCVLP